MKSRQEKKRNILRRIIILIVIIICAQILSFALFRLGVIPTLDDPVIQKEAEEIKEKVLFLLEKKDTDIMHSTLVLRERSKTKKEDGEVEGALVFAIGGDLDNQLSVTWKLEDGERVITQIKKKGIPEPLYEHK